MSDFNESLHGDPGTAASVIDGTNDINLLRAALTNALRRIEDIQERLAKLEQEPKP